MLALKIVLLFLGLAMVLAGVFWLFYRWVDQGIARQEAFELDQIQIQLRVAEYRRDSLARARKNWIVIPTLPINEEDERVVDELMARRRPADVRRKL